MIAYKVTDESAVELVGYYHTKAEANRQAGFGEDVKVTRLVLYTKREIITELNRAAKAQGV